MAPPRATVSALVVDCREPAALAAFWQQVLGGVTVPFEQFGVVALRAPGVTFDFARTDDERRVKNRVHLDVASEDPAATVDHIVRLGGTRAPDIAVSDRFTVMRDPEGNEFCVLHDAVVEPWAPSG
ncbi:MAG: VOC family protein [Actinomycetota bacterium]